jgi:hypothetical protein
MTYAQLLGAFCGLLVFSCTEHPTEPIQVAEPVQSRKQLSSSDAVATGTPVVSPDSSAENGMPPSGCRANFIYEVREPAVAGQANVFVGITDWDGSKEACWYDLSEYYHNIAPDSGVTLQKAYFIAEPTRREVKKVSNWSQMTEEVKSRVIGLSIYDREADTLSFEETPFIKSNTQIAVEGQSPCLWDRDR